MIQLIKRNLRIYYRDPPLVFFSLLTVVITIGIYILFLSDFQTNIVKDALGDYKISDNNIDWIIHTWILSGLLSIIPVTSSLASLSAMVQDRQKKILMDFKSMPISTYVYPLSIILASALVGTVMGLLGFIFYALYIFVFIGKAFTFNQILVSVLLIIFNALHGVALMGCLANLFKTTSGFSSLNIIVGTIIGFINGVYIPLGILPNSVQNAIHLFPSSHIAVLLRNYLMEEAVNSNFSGIAEANKNYYINLYGIRYFRKGGMISLKESFLFVSAVTVIAFIGFMVLYNRKKNEY